MSVNDIRKEVTKDLFEVKEGSSELNATFIFGNEDHTLGNMLRHILVQRKDVEFCGYSGRFPLTMMVILPLTRYFYGSAASL